MRVLFLFFFAVVTVSLNPINGQKRNFSFIYQKEIDDFAINYPDHFDVGGLYINGSNNITNLDGLSQIISADYLAITGFRHLSDLSGLNNLKKINHALYIGHNYSLVSLEGLGEITSISGIRIEYNIQLTSLNGLAHLKNVDDIYITDNPNLLSLNGLENVDKLNFLTVTNNNKLINLKGLEGLREVISTIEIWRNQNLVSPEGLTNLQFTENLDIGRNPSLTSLNGLESLKYVGTLRIVVNDALETLGELGALERVNFMYIFDNPALLTPGRFEQLKFLYHLLVFNNPLMESLGEFPNLYSVDFIDCYDNPALKSLEGLGDFEPRYTRYFEFRDCASLSLCAHPPLCRLLEQYPGRVFLENNAPGCDTTEEVIESCEPIPPPPPNSTCHTSLFITMQQVECEYMSYEHAGAMLSRLPTCGHPEWWPDVWFNVKSTQHKFIIDIGTLPFEKANITVYNTCGGEALFCSPVEAFNSYEVNSPKIGYHNIRLSWPQAGNPEEKIELCLREIPELTLHTEAFPPVICEGGTSVLKTTATGVAPFSYLWSHDGSREEVVAVSPEETTVYSVTVTDAIGNELIQQITVIADNSHVLKPEIIGENLICSGTEGLLKVSIDSQYARYLWNTGDTTHAVLWSEPGTYIANVLYGGCSGSDSIVTDTIHEILNLRFVTTLSSIRVEVNGGTPPYTYEWNTEDNNSLIFPGEEGIFSVTVTDRYGCSVTDSVSFIRVSSHEEPSDFVRLDVFPNPVKDILYIDYDNNYSSARILLFDTRGHLVHQQHLIKGRNAINTDNLSPGVYIYSVSTPQQKILRINKLVKI